MVSDVAAFLAVRCWPTAQSLPRDRQAAWRRTSVVSTRFAFDEKCLAGMIEIVGMLVVAEQHRVDLADRVGRHRGARQLLQLHMRQLIVAGRIEGRIGEQAKAVDLDQRGGTADQGDGEGHAKLPLATLAGRVTR